MADYEERRTIIEDVPPTGRGIVETQRDTIVQERHGISGVAITALVLAAIAAAVMITLMLTNNSQSREEALARERAAAAQQPAPQPSQPQVVVVPQPQPQSQPSTVPVPVPVPVPAPSQPAASATDAASSNLSIEIDVNKKLLDDSELQTHAITVKFENGTATLSGSVPSEELKTRADKVAMTVKGVRRVINDIKVQP